MICRTELGQVVTMTLIIYLSVLTVGFRQHMLPRGADEHCRHGGNLEGRDVFGAICLHISEQINNMLSHRHQKHEYANFHFLGLLPGWVSYLNSLYRFFEQYMHSVERNSF